MIYLPSQNFSKKRKDYTTADLKALMANGSMASGVSIEQAFPLEEEVIDVSQSVRDKRSRT